MTKMVEQFAPQILTIIQQSQNILLHCHPSPDPDSVGGALAMMHALEAMGKKVTVIKGDSEIPVAFSGLPGIEKIASKTIWDIDLTRFDLFLIQDSSTPLMISRKEGLVFPENVKTIVIDHHVSNIKFAQINLVDSSYIAVCQILYDLFKLWNVSLTPEIAVCLFMGMYTDSGGFKYQGTTKDTFAAASELVGIAPEYTKAIFILENSNTVGQIAFQTIAYDSITTHCNNRVAISAVPAHLIKEKNIQQQEMKSDIASTLKSVIGWDLGISMVEEEVGKVKISFRTRNSAQFDVSKIAAALGGGGHKAAAGAFVQLPLEQAKQKVIEAIIQVYPDFS